MQIKNIVEQFIYEQLTYSTGKALGDSGDAYGRHWQRNQKKTLEDFKNEPEVFYDGMPEKEGEKVDSTDIGVTVSLFHYLTSVLTLDELCEEYNAIKCNDWDWEEAYGVSNDGARFLKSYGFEVVNTWNTYNGENNLSQVLQGANLKHNAYGEGDYILMQIHNGCDVRGGYTDAKLYKLLNAYEGINPTPTVYATLTKRDGTTISLDTGYNGWSLTNEEGESVEIQYGDKLEMSL